MSSMKLSIVRGSACGIYRRGNIRLKYAPALRDTKLMAEINTLILVSTPLLSAALSLAIIV